MNLDVKQKDQVKGFEIEKVENEKQEYKIVGSFLRTKGLKLFSYNHFKSELSIIEESSDEDVKLTLVDGKLIPKYNTCTEAFINSNDTHFEALNIKTAKKRVERFLNGKIESLSNLRENNPKPIYNF